MLNVFTLANGRLFQEEIDHFEELAHVQPVWVDLEAPTAEEKGWSIFHSMAPNTKPSIPRVAWAPCAKHSPAVCRPWTTKVCATPATAI